MDGPGSGFGRLRTPLQGALAGGGDPASSPLYVFGPFLALLVGTGVAPETFGASIWLAVTTIVVVSVMYRLVMRWVTDGSGGTGLSEEEFGGWAARINAAITVIEFSLTFAVSVAALVTFVADRVPELRNSVLGIEGRTLAALAVTVLCAVLVNRGPRTVSAVFGPATGAVLVLLWMMVVATLLDQGFRPASFHPGAFVGEDLGYTLGGYVRILAVMTGVEVFANLVAAYDGPAEVRSRKAFQSLSIIMGTTAVAMVIVGPAVLALADPNDPDVSVFTQTMDALLPSPLAILGSVAGVAVLLSAAAASALGLQSLAGGLSIRHYAPEAFGVRNRHGVAALPVWGEAAAVGLCFVLLGTDEAIYLGVYAAGVFVLLSMTGWAATARLWRRRRSGSGLDRVGLASALAAALLTSAATVVIFYERLRDGVWIYFVLIPLLFAAFGVVRRWRGPPDALTDRLGRLEANAASVAGWANELVDPSRRLDAESEAVVASLDGDRPPRPGRVSLGSAVLHVPVGHARVARRPLLVPLDGSANAERALAAAVGLVQAPRRDLVLLHALDEAVLPAHRAEAYLASVAAVLGDHGLAPLVHLVDGPAPDAILACAVERDRALVVMGTHGHTGLRQAVVGSVTAQVVVRASVPVLTVPPQGVPLSTRRRRPPNRSR